MSTCSEDMANFKYKLCKGLTYHNGRKLVQISNSVKNNTTFFNNSNKKHIVFNVPCLDGVMSYDKLKENIHSNLNSIDQIKFSDNFSIYEVNQNFNDSIIISAEGSATANRAQPTEELDDSFEGLPGIVYLFCIVEFKEKKALQSSLGGSSNTKPEILYNAIQGFKGSMAQIIATSNSQNNVRLDPCFFGIKFVNSSGHYLSNVQKKDAVYAIIEAAGSPEKVYENNPTLSTTVYDYCNQIKKNIASGNYIYI